MSTLPPALRRQSVIAALLSLNVLNPMQTIRFNQHGRVVVDLRDPEARSIFASQSFNPEMFPIFETFLNSDGAFFDVGSNFGLFTFGLIPNARAAVQWHLFEANPDIIPAIRLSAAMWPDRKVYINHGCVSDEQGTLKHAVPGQLWGQGQVGVESGRDVTTLVLDKYIAARGISSVAFMKMDIEGWELKALKGAHKGLRDGIVRAGWIELHPVHLSRSGSSVTSVIEYLRDSGFDVCWCGLWNYPNSHLYQGIRLKDSGRRVDIGNVSLRVAEAAVTDEFLAGDALIVHRSSPMSPLLRQ